MGVMLAAVYQTLEAFANFRLMLVATPLACSRCSDAMRKGELLWDQATRLEDEPNWQPKQPTL